VTSMVTNRYHLGIWQNAVAVLISCWVLCPTSSHARIELRDVTEETGISFRHTDGSSGKHFIIEYISAGLALFDYDGDGDIDIYFLNGAPLRGTLAEVTPKNALYRNDGGWKFTDVTDEAGVGDVGHGLGVAVGDYDSDGDLDLYVNNYGPNVLYRNNGNGTFTNVTQAAYVGNGHKVGAGVNFLDMDKDGDLDLFVSNYIKFSYDKHVTRTKMGFPVYPSPRDYRPDPDVLYRNNGDGTFTDVTAAAGIEMYAGPGMGTICADYDNDGDTDIFIGNDVEANFLFQNNGEGMFKEVAIMAGVAYDFSGMEHGSMGAECGDYDNDGLLDFHVTSYRQELATLYKNMGNGLFEDVTIETGAGIGTRRHVTWGSGLVDFDNDGDRDLFIACGDLDDNVERFEDIFMYNSPNNLLLNTGDGKFVNVSDKCGDGLAVKLSSRGAGFDDLDNDGDIDVVILNSRREPTILRNDSANNNHWIQIYLKGVKTNRDGIGAHVKVIAGDLVLLDEVHSGRGYQSHYGMRLHFGLGNRDKVDRIEVRWIGGGIDVFENIAVDRLITLTEGGSQTGAK